MINASAVYVVQLQPGGRPMHVRTSREIDGVRHWWCNDCKAWVPEADFYALPKHVKSRCGLQSVCKVCQNKRSEARRRRRRQDAKARAAGATLITQLLGVASGLLVHTCDRRRRRDPNCPACQVITQGERLSR